MISRNLLIIAVAAVTVCIACPVAYIAMQGGGTAHPVEYELNGGTLPGDYPSSYRPGEILDIGNPLKDGFVFSGWYTDDGMSLFFDGDTSGMSGTLRLHARWVGSPAGHYIQFSETGECERGMSSYVMTGTENRMFHYESQRNGMLFTQTMGTALYDYTQIGEKSVVPTFHSGWEYAMEGWRYQGTETIETVNGDKECEVYSLVRDGVASGTRWIGDGWIIYRECYMSADDSGNETVTYLYKDDGTIGVTPECTITVYTGDGITVTGNDGRYMQGDLATITADVLPDRTFDGWYDTDLNLISSERTYTFEVPWSFTIFAMNTYRDMFVFESDREVDLDAMFGLTAAEYTIKNLDTGDSMISGSTHTFSDSGSYVITARAPSELKIYTVKVTGGSHHDYQWWWGRDLLSVSLDIDYDDYLYAKEYFDLDERRQDKPGHERDSSFVTLGYEDERMAPYIIGLADSLVNAYMELNPDVDMEDYLDYLLSFVQSIPYQTDEEYLGHKEYWKLPLETLFEYGGDCEDTAILFAALAHESMRTFGFDCDVALQILPGHVGGAVRSTSLSGETNPYGYLYGETTVQNYRIGDIPSTMKDSFVDSGYYPRESFTVEIA